MTFLWIFSLLNPKSCFSSQLILYRLQIKFVTSAVLAEENEGGEIDLLLLWNNILLHQTLFPVSDNSRSEVNTVIALTSCHSLSLRMEPWKQSAAVLLYLRELLVVLLFCCSLNIQTNTLDLSLDRGCSSIPPQALSLSLTHKSSTAPPFTPCWVEQLKASVSSWQSPHGRLESVGRLWVCWLRRFMTCKCVG